MRPGNAAAAMVFAISMVSSYPGRCESLEVLLPQQGDTKNHADNLFALTAQGGNVDLLRVLRLAAEQESSSSSVRTSSSVPPRQLKLMAAESRGHGFFLEHLQAASNPLVHAVLYRQVDMVRYLLDHSPFKALIDFAEIRNLFVPLHSRYTASKSALSTACEGPEDAGDASRILTDSLGGSLRCG